MKELTLGELVEKRKRAANDAIVEENHYIEQSNQPPRKRNKHAPAEMKSNRPVSILREFSDQKAKAIDPRFSEATGKLDYHKFYQNYDFIDDIEENEIKSLEKVLRKVKNTEKKEDLQKEIARRRQRLSEKRRSVSIENRKRDLFRAEQQKVSQGKTPYFPKKSEMKKIELEEKYRELKSSGKLQKYMEKKRKRNASKDHVSLPNSRRA